MKTPRIAKTIKQWLTAVLVLALLLWVGIAEAKVALNQQLVEAAKDGDLSLVKGLLDKGADVNTRLRDGSTVLMWAIMRGNEDVVKELLNRGADINAKDSNGSTPLAWAAIMDRSDMVKLLRSGGAEITLPVAALIGDKREVQRLLDTGADVNAPDALGWTPLMNAAQKGHADVVRLLLDKSADIYAKRQDESTALRDAFDGGKADVLAVLLEKAGRPNFLDRLLDVLKRLTVRRPSTLNAACYWGQTEIVNLLLDKGADANEKDWYGRTPLMIASEAGHFQVVRLLLDKGANVNEKDRNGFTGLMYACMGGNLQVVRLLLDKGADVNAASAKGDTPLVYARGQIREILKAHGAKIRRPRRTGYQIF